ncbi:MAG TPA: S41 family peptidase [Planctomycetota bacterium]|nr:S41 family peptidase [Planctomycetota bacterium]
MPLGSVRNALVPALLLVAACATDGAASLRDGSARAAVSEGVVATLDRQDHYFRSPADRRRFELALRRIATESEDASSYYAAMSDALASLDEGHTSLAGSAEVPFASTIPPVAIVDAEGACVIAGVAPGVEGGGLVPGDLVLSVEGVPGEEALRQRIAVTPGSTAHGKRARAVANLLAGPTREPARVRVLGMDGRERVCFPLRFLLDDEGMDRFRFGFLQESVSAVPVSATTAYVALPDFSPERLAELEDAVRAMGITRTVVLDLRGNPGGRIRTLQRIAGIFLDGPDDLLILTEGEHKEVLRAIPGEVRFRGRLRILVDGRTGSAAELLAAALKDLGRAKVYGTATAGSTRSRLSQSLPGGVRLHYAGRAEFRRRDGSPIEGIGVEPDVRFEHTREQLARGSYGDPFLDPLVRLAAE